MLAGFNPGQNFKVLVEHGFRCRLVVALAPPVAPELGESRDRKPRHFPHRYQLDKFLSHDFPVDFTTQLAIRCRYEARLESLNSQPISLSSIDLTDFRSESSLDARIRTARRARGRRTARELADTIVGGNLTEAIIENVEAGRKVALDVNQLLNIAMVLRVPPSYMLAPLSEPDRPLDLPNLSDALCSYDRY